MNWWRGKNIKNDNAGFSLIELIIAILILAIITMPFLRLFVTSATVNNKSRRELRATSLAQDIMEGVKSYDLKGLLREFGTDETGSEYVSADDFAVIAKASVDSKYVKEIPPASADSRKSYEFYVTGVKYENSKFNAKITLNPNRFYSHEYMEAGKEIYETLNNDEITSISSVNSANYEYMGSEVKKDGSFKADTKVDGKILEMIKTDHPSVSSYKDINVLGREIEITFDPIAGSDQIQTTIDISYTYKYFDDVGYINARRTVHNTDLDLLGGVTFDSGNYYFYYYPLYKATGGVKDSFKITKNVPDDIRLYIVKQKYIDNTYIEGTHGVTDLPWTGEFLEEELSVSNLHNAEFSYGAQFNLVNCDDFVIRTNLNTCLGDDINDIAELNQITPKLSDVFYDLSGRGIFDSTKRDSKVNDDFIFDVTIQVFEDKPGFSFDSATAADELVILTGNMNN